MTVKAIRRNPRVAIATLVLALAAVASPVAYADDVSDGNRALREGRLDAALASFEKAAGAGSAAGQAGIGRVWLRRSQHGRAAEAFRRAVEIDPRLAMGWYGQAEVLRREGKCDAAIPLYRKATDLDRKFPEAQLGLGNCLVAIGRIDEGIAELNQGIKWGKEWGPRFLAARGAAHMARDSLRSAGVDFTRARELAPRDVVVRRAAGDFYFQRGTWALAIPEYEEALKLDPNDIEAQYALAQALYYNQEYDRALAAYQRVTEIDSSYAPGLLGLGNLLYAAGAADPRRYAQAREALERYTRLQPDDAKGWSLLGRADHHLGQREQALAEMQRAEQLGDENKELYTLLGKAYADQKDWNRALAAFAKGDPGPREAALIGQVFDVAGQSERADSVYRAILDRDSTSATAALAYNQRAKLRYRAKDFAGARSLFDRAIAIDSKNADAHFYRGLSLKELGQPAEALASLERSVSLDSTRADRYFWLGVLDDGQKRTAEAERAFRRTIELAPEGELAGKAHRQIGYYRLLKKQWKAAIESLERAVALDPQDELAWLWLAQAYQNSGDRAKATRAYKRVLELNPGSGPARQGLRAVQGARS